MAGHVIRAPKAGADRIGQSGECEEADQKTEAPGQKCRLERRRGTIHLIIQNPAVVDGSQERSMAVSSNFKWCK